MAEYIEREAAIKMMRGIAIAKYPLSFYIGILAAADELQKMPAADVAPVVHGRWEKQRGIYCCSECGKAKPYDVQADNIEYFHCNYCRNCGAKMDLGYQMANKKL